MSKIIETLASLADKLDGAKLVKTADVVDSVSNSVLKIVEAQYEGVQGYWIRNSRCWSNCYRQKRESTKKPAQVVWAECHKEYLSSLDKETSDWDKYAGNDTSLIKIGSVDKKIISAEQKKFHNGVNERIEAGFDLPTAIFDTMQMASFRQRAELEHQIVRLANVSAHLNKIGKTTLSQEVALAVDELSKFAQFGMGSGWFNPKNWGQGAKEFMGGLTGGISPQILTQRLTRVMQSIENLRTRFPADMSVVPQQMQGQLNQQMGQLQQQVAGEVQWLGEATRNNPAVGRIYQLLMPAFNQFSQQRDFRSRRLALDGLAKAVNQASGVVQTLPATQLTGNPRSQQAPGARPASPTPQPQPQPQDPNGTQAPANAPNAPQRPATPTPASGGNPQTLWKSILDARNTKQWPKVTQLGQQFLQQFGNQTQPAQLQQLKGMMDQARNGVGGPPVPQPKPQAPGATPVPPAASQTPATPTATPTPQATPTATTPPPVDTTPVSPGTATPATPATDVSQNPTTQPSQPKKGQMIRDLREFVKNPQNATALEAKLNELLAARGIKLKFMSGMGGENVEPATAIASVFGRKIIISQGSASATSGLGLEEFANYLAGLVRNQNGTWHLKDALKRAGIDVHIEGGSTKMFPSKGNPVAPASAANPVADASASPSPTPTAIQSPAPAPAMAPSEEDRPATEEELAAELAKLTGGENEASPTPPPAGGPEAAAPVPPPTTAPEASPTGVESPPPVSTDPTMPNEIEPQGEKQKATQIGSQDKQFASQMDQQLQGDPNRQNMFHDQKGTYRKDWDEAVDDVLSAMQDGTSVQNPASLAKAKEFASSLAKYPRQQNVKKVLKQWLSEYDHLLNGQNQQTGMATAAKSKKHIKFASLDSGAKRFLVKLKKGF